MKTSYLAIGVAALGLLAACNQNQPGGDAVNATQDAASTAVGQTSATVLGSNTVDGFVTGAAISDMYELKAADIAKAKSSNADIKALAGTITTDHTASTAKLKSIAPTAAPDVAMPTSMDERRQGLIDNLNAASAADFDKVWLQQQVAAHQEALTMLNGFADNTDHPELAAFAREVSPKVQMHLDRAKALLDAM